MPTFLGVHATDFDSNPIDFVSSRQHSGVVQNITSVDEIPDTANGDNMIICRVPVDAIVRRVRFGCDALGAGTADIGTYRKNTDGTYTAVDDDCFASAIAVTSAVAVTDVTYEAAATDISKALQPLWQRSALSARPAYGDLYIGYTFDTGTSAVATAILEVDYLL